MMTKPRIPSPATDDGPRAPTEWEIVLSWEEEQFRHLGLNDYQAAALTDAGISWHEAERLVRRGCPLHVVVDLLL